SRSRRARIAAGRGAMNRARVVVTDHAFGDTARERAMAGELGAEFLEYACRTEEETIDAVAGAAVVFVNFAPITRAVIEQLPVGATIIRYGIGYDNVDIAAAT